MFMEHHLSSPINIIYFIDICNICVMVILRHIRVIIYKLATLWNLSYAILPISLEGFCPCPVYGVCTYFSKNLTQGKLFCFSDDVIFRKDNAINAHTCYSMPKFKSLILVPIWYRHTVFGRYETSNSGNLAIITILRSRSHTDNHFTASQWYMHIAYNSINCNVRCASI